MGTHQFSLRSFRDVPPEMYSPFLPLGWCNVGGGRFVAKPPLIGKSVFYAPPTLSPKGMPLEISEGGWQSSWICLKIF